MFKDSSTAGKEGTIASIGHNSEDQQLIEITVCGFNSLSKYVKHNGAPITLTMPFGSTLGDIINRLDIPKQDIFLAMRNGRDVNNSLYSELPVDTLVDEGDRISFSGPVPYSWGYGSPVV